jgi:hypothetical protein
MRRGLILGYDRNMAYAFGLLKHPGISTATIRRNRIKEWIYRVLLGRKFAFPEPPERPRQVYDLNPDDVRERCFSPEETEFITKPLPPSHITEPVPLSNTWRMFIERTHA